MANKTPQPKKMNSKIIIYIGILILSISCNSNLEKSSNQDRNEESERINNPQPITPALKENTVEAIEEVEEIEEEEPALIRDKYLHGIIEQDSTVFLMATMRKNYSLFGYETPSTKSKKLFLFSVFTDEVEGNPSNCDYGSFYDSSEMERIGMTLKYTSDTLGFRKLMMIRNNLINDFAYVEKKWLEFESDE